MHNPVRSSDTKRYGAGKPKEMPNTGVQLVPERTEGGGPIGLIGDRGRITKAPVNPPRGARQGWAVLTHPIADGDHIVKLRIGEAVKRFSSIDTWINGVLLEERRGHGMNGGRPPAGTKGLNRRATYPTQYGFGQLRTGTVVRADE